MTPKQRWLVERRICCPEAGYPHSEARYPNVKAYWEDMERMAGEAIIATRHPDRSAHRLYVEHNDQNTMQPSGF